MKSKKLYANATYVLGIDPSGAYDEGKGTTGWNIMCCATKEVIEVGTISALDYKTRMEYWDAHTQLIRRCANQYDKMVLSIEDYMLYKKAALSQVNSTFETVQLLGIIKFFAWNYAVPWFIRHAAAVMTRWTNEILMHKGIIYISNGKYYCICRKGVPLCEHEIDSIKHSMHFACFENEER